MAKKLFTDSNFLKAFLLVCAFLVGGFHMAVSCVLTVIILFFLIYKSFTQKDFSVIKPNAVLLTIGLIVFSYLISTIWAIDRGTAIYGFFKVLPVGLFAAVLSMYDKTTRNEVLESVPYVAVANGVLAYGLSFVPALSEYFLVADRLGGFFQSPNIFAAFCLVGIIVLLTSEKINAKNLILTALLVVIILLTGSRTVFIFLILTIAVLVLKIKNRKVKLSVLGILLFVIGASVVVVLVTGNMQTVGRFLTISLESSTLLGRILYYLDAIPVILKNPFGLGYYGYYFTQGSFQTGVYSVAYVHNSVLQFFLDIGFVPAIAFVALVVASFFSKNTDFRQKLVLFVLFGHSLLDFDMEFAAIFMVLILALDFDLLKIKTVECHPYAVTGVSLVLVLLSVYFGIVNTMFLFGEHKAVDKIYGHDTMAKMYLITNETNESICVKYADEIIAENGYLAIAYDVKANEAYGKGDFQKVMDYKNKAIECSPYSIDEYKDFCEKLFVGVSLYSNANDFASANACKKELIEIQEKLEDVEENTNEIAWKIQDTPQLKLPAEYVKQIEGYKESEK